MQQPQVTSEVSQEITFPDTADIAEVRTMTAAASCNQLLADGWVLLGVFPVTRIGEMTEGQPNDGQRRKQLQDTQRYVRRLVGYSWVCGWEETRVGCIRSERNLVGPSTDTLQTGWSAMEHNHIIHSPTYYWRSMELLS